VQTPGEFYKEKVLSLPRNQRFQVEQPHRLDDPQIEEDLFGYKLRSGRRALECRSKEEAKYLKIYFDLSLRTVWVPKDLSYIKEIIPKLELIKTRLDEKLEKYGSGILSRRIREQLKWMVYSKVMVEAYEHNEGYEENMEGYEDDDSDKKGNNDEEEETKKTIIKKKTKKTTIKKKTIKINF